jgi:hypothetical protein
MAGLVNSTLLLQLSAPPKQAESGPSSKNGQSDKGCDKGRDKVLLSPGFWDKLHPIGNIY